MPGKVVIVPQSEVPRLLPMTECIEVMAEVLTTLAKGQAVQPLRTGLRLEDKGGSLVSMPAYTASPPALGIKVISVFLGNHGTEFASHQGAVLLFEPEHGELRAIIDATSITAIRTAAVSGVATRLLARSDADDLAILGSGVQA